MNTVIAQYDHHYLELLIHYNNALMQRNKLLKDFAVTGRFDRESLELWDEQLVVPGEKIGDIRRKFVEALVPVFQKHYAFISGDSEKVGLHYQSHLLEGDFRESLKQTVEKDRILQFTTTGVHKDDLLLKLGDHPIKRTGSQGQQKTYMVALKIAQFDFISKQNGQQPILLLDDIFDKFDQTRVTKIIELFADNHFGQIFITDTHHDRMLQVIGTLDIDYRMFRIADNQIKS